MSFSWRETRVGRAGKRVRVAMRRRDARQASFERRLVWMLGSPRTGSSWLMTLLAEHDAVVPVDEPLVGWYLGPFLSDLPGSDAEALDVSNFTLRRVLRDKRSHLFAEEFSDAWLPPLRGLMLERFHAHAIREDCRTPPSERIVVIKEPNGSQSADVILRALPRSRLLFLLRDGRDVVDSDLAANLRGSWVTREFPGMTGIGDEDRLRFVVQSAQKWLWRTEVVQQAAKDHRGPRHTLRYEDLLGDPARELRKLLDWLGLEASGPQLQMWSERWGFQRMSSGTTGPGEFFRSASPGAWRENLRGPEQAALERILGPKLRELGYA